MILLEEKSQILILQEKTLQELCSPAEDPEVVPPAHDTEEGFTR